MSLSSQICQALAPLPTEHLIPELAWEMGAVSEPVSIGLAGRRGPQTWGVLVPEKRRLKNLDMTEKGKRMNSGGC